MKENEPPLVYLAAPYSARDYIQAVIRPWFEGSGCKVISTWHEEKHPLTDDALGAAPVLDDEAAMRAAQDCLLEVEDCEFFVMFAAPFLPSQYVTSGGMNVEFGVALVNGCFPILVGQPANIFHRLGMVRQVNSIPEATGLIFALTESYKGDDDD